MMRRTIARVLLAKTVLIDTFTTPVLTLAVARRPKKEKEKEKATPQQHVRTTQDRFGPSPTHHVHCTVARSSAKQAGAATPTATLR
jgi:hypothetical protein